MDRHEAVGSGFGVEYDITVIELEDDGEVSYAGAGYLPVSVLVNPVDVRAKVFELLRAAVDSRGLGDKSNLYRKESNRLNRRLQELQLAFNCSVYSRGEGWF